MPSDPDPYATVRMLLPSCSGRDPADTVAAESAARAVAQSGALIKRVTEDAELRSLLAPHGFSAEAFAAGESLLAAAETQIDGAGQAGDAHAAACAEREALWIAAREEYLEFRAAVRAEFREHVLHRLLCVAGTVAAELPRFIAQAAASYRAAGSPSVAGPLARRSFDGERVARAQEILDRLVALDELVVATHARWRRAADERELAAQMLTLWTGELLKSMRLAFGRTRRPPAAMLRSCHRQQEDRLGRRSRVTARKLGPPPAP